MPFPATKVIPEAWSQHHAPVAVGGMNGKCRIYDPATATLGWDEVNEKTTVTAGEPVYDGRCRIEARFQAGQVVQGDDAESPREYLIELEWDAAPINPDFQLVPYECINDSRLNGETLTISDEEVGTERFSRAVFATRVQH